MIIDASSNSIILVSNVNSVVSGKLCGNVAIHIFLLEIFSLVSHASVEWSLIDCRISTEAGSTTWKVDGLHARSLFGGETVSEFSAMLRPVLKGQELSCRSGSGFKVLHWSLSNEIRAVVSLSPVVVEETSGWTSEKLVLSTNGSDGGESYEFHLFYLIVYKL